MIDSNAEQILSPFRVGEVLTAEKLDAMRQAIAVQQSQGISRGVQDPYGSTSNNRTVTSTNNMRFKNSTGGDLDSYSIFTLDKETSLTSGSRNQPWVDIELNEEGLTYFTNEKLTVGDGIPFTGRNISSVYPARIRYSGKAPVLGEECGPADDGSGTITENGVGYVCIQTPDSLGSGAATFTTTHTGDLFTSVGHGLVDDNTIELSTDDTLPAGVNPNTTYWVINATTDTFQLSLTQGGAAIAITDDGTGTHTWTALAKASDKVMAWIQSIGGTGGSGHIWVGVLDPPSGNTLDQCGTVPFLAYGLETINDLDPTGYCGIEDPRQLPSQVINISGITFTTGALYFAFEIVRWKFPVVFPAMIIECLEEIIGPSNP